MSLLQSGGEIRTRQVQPNPGHFPIAFTVICLDCEEVFDGRGPSCVNCASTNFWPLLRWLGERSTWKWLEAFQAGKGKS